jgi:FkbM family methyltransferase
LRVKFAEREIVLPLTAARIGLDWGLAVSLLGHDAEVKETYASFLLSSSPPDLFVDVGTNYGADSLLFLAHDIRTISFEPNPDCHGYFRECASLNGVRPDIRAMVVGDSHEPVELLFREGETWNGSADPDIQRQLRDGGGGRLRKLSVEQTTLDDALAGETAQRMLIKIDAEGFEIRVLRGARNVLAERKPSVIFEAWPDAAVRAQLFGLLAESRYALFALPWRHGAARPLTRAGFESAAGMNFIAFPAG